MTATDPRAGLPRTPIRGLAAMLAERLAPTATDLCPASLQAGEPIDNRTASCPNRPQRMNSGHAKHDIS